MVASTAAKRAKRNRDKWHSTTEFQIERGRGTIREWAVTVYDGAISAAAALGVDARKLPWRVVGSVEDTEHAGTFDVELDQPDARDRVSALIRLMSFSSGQRREYQERQKGSKGANAAKPMDEEAQLALARIMEDFEREGPAEFSAFIVTTVATPEWSGWTAAPRDFEDDVPF